MTHKIENHECFDTLVEETGSDATFEKALGISFKDGMGTSQWVINLYRYTPSLAVSTIRGYFIPNFCPMCGEDFRDDKSNDQEK